MPETKHDLVAFVKKLQPHLDSELKQSLPTCTRPTPSTLAQPEQNEALVANSSHEDGRKKEVFCSYCERKSHKKAQFRKK